MSRKRFSLYCFIFFIGLFAATYALAGRLPKKFAFKEQDALSEWQEKIFRGRVLYSIKAKKEDGYLHAYSDNAASGIFYEIKFDPKEFPMMSWQWKVLKFPGQTKSIDEADATEEWIEKDDYAARVYVIFPRLSFNLTRCLEYIWDQDMPAETIITSPYSDNIKLIVAESGKKNLGKWVSVERNIYEDYKKAYGRKPGHVGAIAIMTDTDNTQSTAEAHYKALKVGYRHEDQNRF